MIASLRGRLLDKHPQRVVIDVNGVGYDVQVPLSTFYNLGEPGTEVALRVHTHVREDAIALFGFMTSLELELFERLIGISGVGPKLALAVLSGIEPEGLVRAVRLQDVARLTAIPGIGRKTSERIALELKDKLPKALQAEPIRPPSAADELRDDVLSALLNLGYQRAAAEKAVDTAVGDGGSFQDVLKRALKSLAR
jgi:Holliday junction DNA helicase RuvA